ncbi:hypothetical protein [Micromonospora tarensis]|uniref:Secreted protein n=1 Tax=Micromonospora tarensis TaxID=2806100 RepID=A0ABS1YD38_9ACTN|nr:hypothetical protein [Micromonospora tarensis]MBM0275331.1 hypothetical protein [Micromonospora tarensis]
MKARTAGFVALAVVPLTIVGAAIGFASAGGDPQQASEPTGAQRVVDAISEKWPLPNPTDTTSGCAAKEGDSAKGCASRITTDAVTVVAFDDEATAARWTKELSKAGDTRQAGRVVLSWTSRDQHLTGPETRKDMVLIAQQAGS